MSQTLNLAIQTDQSRLPAGSYPAMLTAFRDDGAIDWDGIDQLTDDCLDRGAAGIFACGLSAELPELNADEKVAITDRVVRYAAGRSPIIAGAVCLGTIDEQAELVRRVHGAGADVVTISVSQLAGQHEDDKKWLQRAESLLDELDSEIRLSLYECPWPYHRLLSDETIEWVVSTDRFHLMKDTCCDIETIRRRLKLIRGSKLQLYNANTATLLASLEAGASGFCGIGSNYMPEIYAWLCRHYAEQPQLAAEVQDYLTDTVRITEGEFYPASAKLYIRRRGVDLGSFSRISSGEVPASCAEKLDELEKLETEWQQRLFG